MHGSGSEILTEDYMFYPTFEAAVESGYLAAERILEDELYRDIILHGI